MLESGISCAGEVSSPSPGADVRAVEVLHGMEIRWIAGTQGGLARSALRPSFAYIGPITNRNLHSIVVIPYYPSYG